MNAIVFGLVSISVFFFNKALPLKVNSNKIEKVIIEVYNPAPILKPGTCFEIRPEFKDKSYTLVRKVIAEENGYYTYCVVKKSELRCEKSKFSASCKFIDRYFRATRCRANNISADEVYKGLYQKKS
tara:strand:- start:1630 stop:2010 length:381 start_codon:yes stop_codon:yes gene_type:complete